MSVQVKESVHDQPDVSRARPVYVPPNGTRSYTLDVTIINGQGKYQNVYGFWDDIDKLWRYAGSGDPVEHEVVKTDPIKETKQHY